MQRRSRVIRIAVAVLATSLLVGSLTTTPALAQGEHCPKISVWPPQDIDEIQTKLPMKTVPAGATKKDPFTVSYDHGPVAALWGDGVANYAFLPIQVAPRSWAGLLNVRASWPTPSVSEFDLWISDRWGQNIDGSAAYNTPPVDQVEDVLWPNNTGGHGFELVTKIPTKRCDGRGVLIEGFWSAGDRITLEMWFGR